MWQWIIPAAASVIGAVISSRGQSKANEQNAALAQQQMDFQAQQSGTAYQRSMLDMQRAGLNPILAYQQGGASTPQGAMPVMQNESAPILASAQQAVGLYSAIQQANVSQAQVDKIRAETMKIASETMDKDDNILRLQRFNEQLLRRNNLLWAQEDTERERPSQVRSQAQLNKMLEGVRGVQFDRENTTFADDVAIRKAERQLREYAIPGARTDAEFFSTAVGEMNPYLRQLLMLIRAMSDSGQGAAAVLRNIR